MSAPLLSGTRTRRQWLILMALVALWGSSFALNKIAVESMAPIWVASLRLTLAALFMVAYLYSRGQRLSRKLQHWGWFAWLGAIGFAIPFTLIAWGTVHIASSIAGILMATVPLCVLVLGHFLLPDEPLTRRKTAGFLIGFSGTALLVGNAGFQSFQTSSLQLWALLGVTLAALCYALTGISARLMPDMANTPKATGVLITASVMTLPLAIIIAPISLENISIEGGLAVLTLGLLPTALATVLLFLLLREAGASFVALSNYLVPVFAVFIGLSALQESLQWSDWLGLGLVLGGIFVAESPKAGSKNKAKAP